MSRPALPSSVPAFVELDRTAPLDPVQMLRVVWAGKWVIALMTGLSVLLAGYYGFALASPRHAAVALIDTSAAPAPIPASTPADTVKPGTHIQHLLATPTLEQVIERLQLRMDPAFNRYLTPVPTLSVTGVRTRLRNLLLGQVEVPPDAAAISAKLVQNLRTAIRIENPRDSDLLRVTVTAGDPDRAIAIANTLVAVYLEDQVAQKQDRAADSMAWLSARSAELRSAQTDLTTRIAALIAQAGLQDPQRHDTLGRQLQDTAARLTSATAALDRAGDVANRQRLTAQTAALRASHDDLAAELDALTAAGQARDRLQADLDANLAQQAEYRVLIQDLTLQMGQIAPDSRVLNAATEAQYIGPQKLLLLQIATVVGALAGLMLVALRQSLRRGFVDAQALQDATGLPVLAQLPLLPSRRPARLLAALTAADATAATEGFRHLRTALLLRGATVPQVILSTSAIPGEGKTTQAIGLAQSMASLGRRVLLIDGDLRQGAFRRYFRLRGTDGLAAVILGHIALAAATEPSAIPGVDLLAGGATDATGAETLFLPGLADVIAQARGAYDVVVIDAPPVVPVPDALALARHADAVVLAVRWDKTPASVLLAATEKLAAAEVEITGLTLTQINSRRQAQRGGFGFARYGRGYFHA